MKTFKEQIAAIMKERDREVNPRDLAECTTPAAQTLMTYMRQWEFGSRNIALARLLECDRWSKDGTMVLERDHKGRMYPFKMSLRQAYEAYRYGDQRKQFWPMYSFARGIKNIPANITPDWAKELQGMFFDMGRMTMQDVRLISLGKWVKSLSSTNPHAIAGWEREVSEWKDAQKAVDEFVTAKGKGWAHLTSTNLQKPAGKVAMSKVLEDILAAADAVVEPAFKALREQQRRENIRRDATMARNDIKGLKGFFQKYAVATPNALELLAGIINDVESQTLNEPTKGDPNEA